jgi:hypothetical protein
MISNCMAILKPPEEPCPELVLSRRKNDTELA